MHSYYTQGPEGYMEMVSVSCLATYSYTDAMDVTLLHLLTVTSSEEFPTQVLVDHIPTRGKPCLLASFVVKS